MMRCPTLSELPRAQETAAKLGIEVHSYVGQSHERHFQG